MNKEARTLFVIGGAIIALLVVFGLLYGNTKPGDKPVDSEILVSADSQVITATADEKVVVVEFSDFQCPACLAAESTMSEMRKKYAENLTFVYRHFPLNGHPYGELAALAAEAAAAQGKFWEMHDKLFETQPMWGSLTEPLEAADVREQFIGYARELELDVAKFTTDLDNETYISVIQQGRADGSSINVPGTPTFFVNGVETKLNDLETAIQTAIQQ